MNRARPELNGLALPRPAHEKRGDMFGVTDDGAGLWSEVRNITLALLCAGPLMACVNVNAPNDAIVIELNINIKQEVLYRLVESAEQNIEDNPEIF